MKANKNTLKTLIIIPAYNESQCIRAVVENLISNYPQYDYLVVNDGSSDNTEEICAKNNFNYISMPLNQGLSGAVMAGMQYAYNHNYDCVVQYDGDGQHRAEYINQLEQEISNGFDIVIGSRFITKKKPNTMRMFGSHILSGTIKLITRQVITDPTSGMRMFNKKVVEEYVNSINFDPEPDTIAFLIRDGYKVKEVQVEMNERQGGVSKFNISSSIWYMFRMFISLIFIHWFRRRLNK